MLIDSAQMEQPMFPEDIEDLAARCKFRDCAHGAEPGCAVRAALDSGALDEARWRGFSKSASQPACAVE